MLIRWGILVGGLCAIVGLGKPAITASWSRFERGFWCCSVRMSPDKMGNRDFNQLELIDQAVLKMIFIRHNLQSTWSFQYFQSLFTVVGINQKEIVPVADFWELTRLTLRMGPPVKSDRYFILMRREPGMPAALAATILQEIPQCWSKLKQRFGLSPQFFLDEEELLAKFEFSRFLALDAALFRLEQWERQLEKERKHEPGVSDILLELQTIRMEQLFFLRQLLRSHPDWLTDLDRAYVQSRIRQFKYKEQEISIRNLILTENQRSIEAGRLGKGFVNAYLAALPPRRLELFFQQQQHENLMNERIWQLKSHLSKEANVLAHNYRDVLKDEQSCRAKLKSTAIPETEKERFREAVRQLNQLGKKAGYLPQISKKTDVLSIGPVKTIGNWI